MQLSTVFDILRHRYGRPPVSPPGTIGVIAIMKNEGMNLREWVDHYRWQGADKIFLIDNGSDDGSRGLIAAEITSGYVEYHSRLKPHSQVEHIQEMYRTCSVENKVEWLLMVDLDEFVYSPLGSLKLALAVLAQDADLIYMNWRMFGSAGHREHPKSLRRNLNLRQAALGRHCNSKWLCRTRSIRSPDAIGIHKVRWVDSDRTVSDNELLKLNHYVTQSLDYFTKIKMVRGDATNALADKVRDMAYFEFCNADMSVFDNELGRLLDQVRGEQRDKIP